ncbi:MAG: glutamine amidotransferase [Desulfuromonadales bacterium]
MKKIFIIKAGSTFTDTAERHGDFDQMAWRGLCIPQDKICVINASHGEVLPDPGACRGVVITGSHSMVTDNLPWSLAIESWIPSLVQAEVPLLGICYGHQLLGRAMGGHVGFHPCGQEVGTFVVRKHLKHNNDPLLGKLPQQFTAHTTHAQSVLSLPPGAVLLAENDFEPHHAFRLGGCAWGVQFHPEFDSHIMRDYIMAQTDRLTRDGQDVNALLQALQETPDANGILATFAQLASEGEGS